MGRVLLAEDNLALQVLYRSSILKLRPKIRIDSVTRAEEMLSYAQKKEYSLILADNQLAGPITGLEAISLLSKSVRTPMYLFSADSSIDALRVRQLGAEDFIAKTSDSFCTTLEAIVQKYL